MRTAVALPVRIDLRDAFDACATELTVTANIDSGGRGRPRVTFDVTQGLSAAGVGVFMADGALLGASLRLGWWPVCRPGGWLAWERRLCAACPVLPLTLPVPLPACPPRVLQAVYIEQPELGPYGAPLVDGPPAQEMHRFLITAQSERRQSECSAGGLALPVGCGLLLVGQEVTAPSTTAIEPAPISCLCLLCFPSQTARRSGASEKRRRFTTWSKRTCWAPASRSNSCWPLPLAPPAPARPWQALPVCCRAAALRWVRPPAARSRTQGSTACCAR